MTAELQDSKGECRGVRGKARLISEVEEQKKTMLTMEGKDEEVAKMESQCQDFRKRLEWESEKGRSMQTEVDKLNCRIIELEKLEDAFNRSKQECLSLKCCLEKERIMSTHLSSELESLKERVKELESTKCHLERSEVILGEELGKLKRLTVMLHEERKTMCGELQQMEKFQSNAKKCQEDGSEETVFGATKKNDLLFSLKIEEEKNVDLQSKLSIMMKKLQSLETLEKDFLRNKTKEEHVNLSSKLFHQEDNKVRDLTREVERLKRKLKDMRTVEEDLVKTENEFQLLERRYSAERERVKNLFLELEKSQKELSEYQQAEKKGHQELFLHKHLQEEEPKSRNLSLKKVHDTDESLCCLKAENSILQKKVIQQEVINKELAKEMDDLTRELEKYRQISARLQMRMCGMYVSEGQVSTKEVQTDFLDKQSKFFATLESDMLNSRPNIENEIRDHPDFRHRVVFSKPAASFKVSNLTTNDMSRRPSINYDESQNSGNNVQQGDVVVSHSLGQPLHIKVTPDHKQNTAMLEITSPTTESHSYTSTAIIPAAGASGKQRITIIQNASISSSPKSRCSSEVFSTPGSPVSSVSVGAYARDVTSNSPETLMSERAMSPIQIVSVTTGTQDCSQSPELVEIGPGHTVLRVTPEKRRRWQIRRLSSSSSNITAQEDGKIHIHVGSSYIRPLSGTSQPVGPSYGPVPEHRAAGQANGTGGKVSSNIIITPNASPLPRHSQITVSNLYE